MARILSIDYGLKRCGIAVTDPLQIIVSGLTTISNNELLSYIYAYCQLNSVEEIVIGYPRHADGSKNLLSQQIDLIKLELEKKLNGIKVNYFDEKGSSKQAMQIMVQGGVRKKKRSDKELLDKMSAVIILQKYLGHI